MSSKATYASVSDSPGAQALLALAFTSPFLLVAGTTESGRDEDMLRSLIVVEDPKSN